MRLAIIGGIGVGKTDNFKFIMVVVFHNRADHIIGGMFTKVR